MGFGDAPVSPSVVNFVAHLFGARTDLANARWLLKRYVGLDCRQRVRPVEAQGKVPPYDLQLHGPMLTPDQIFNLQGVLGGASYQPHRLHEVDSVAVYQSDVSEAVSLYNTRRNLSPVVARKLKVPIDRWIKSTSNVDP